MCHRHVRDRPSKKTELSELVISVSAVARGIAEVDSVGIATNAQAATPISNNRLFGILLGAALSRLGVMVSAAAEFHFQILATAIIKEATGSQNRQYRTAMAGVEFLDESQQTTLVSQS
jgi:hypothetical protein